MNETAAAYPDMSNGEQDPSRPQLSADELDRAKKLRTEAVRIWRHGRYKLYNRTKYSKQKELATLKAIEALFGNAPSEKFKKISSNYLLRINLVASHWEPPLPPPYEFFNPANEDGFRATKDWPNNPEKYPPPPHRRTLPSANSSAPTGSATSLGQLVKQAIHG